jgi:hypothetical protein
MRRFEGGLSNRRPTSPPSRRWAHADGDGQRRLALGDSGQSNLKYSASLTRLADIGPLVGHMLDGRVLVEGTSPGNRADLASKGTAVFSGIKVDDTFDALTLNTAVDAHCRIWTWPR